MFSSLTARHIESQSTLMPSQAHRYDVYSFDTGDDVGWFGSKLVKKASKAAGSVVKSAKTIASAPVHVAKAAVKGQNIVKASGKQLAAVGNAISVVPIAGTVIGGNFKLAGAGLQGKNISRALGANIKTAGQAASYVPGIGTAVGMGLKVAGAGIAGENIVKASVDAAKTSVPYATMAIQAANLASDIAQGKNVAGALVARAAEGALAQLPDYAGQLAKSIANVAAAGVKGQNVLKAGAREVAASAVALAPASARATLNAAINAAAQGKNPLTGAASEAVRTALAQIPDPGARKTAELALSGVPAAQVLAVAPKKLLAQAAAAVPGGGAEVAIKTLTGTMPAKLVRGVTIMNNVRPILTKVTSGRPIFFERASVTGRPSVTGVRHVPMSGAAKAFVRARAGILARDAAGLTSDGKWLVTKGDTGESIAFSLTGSKGRWVELKSVNPTLMKARAAAAKKYGFPIYVNDVINLPAGWVKTTTTSAAKATPVQGNATTIAPSTMTPIQTAIQTVQTVLAPAGDIAAQAAARATLAAWSKTDGLSRAGVSDYGSTVEAVATTWTARDKLEAASFQAWANSVGLSSGATTGDWTQELSDALRSWAERKATQVLTPVKTTVAQTSTPTPTAAQTSTAPTMTLPTNVVTPGVSITPGSASNGEITLPGITITPGKASAGTQQPTQSPSYWAQNKPTLIAGGLGLLASIGAKFIH